MSKRELFTMHIDFIAEDHDEALSLARVYSEGLNVLRGEVDQYGVKVSPSRNWNAVAGAYCCDPGQGYDHVCTFEPDHEGKGIRHHSYERAPVEV